MQFDLVNQDDNKLCLPLCYKSFYMYVLIVCFHYYVFFLLIGFCIMWPLHFVLFNTAHSAPSCKRLSEEYCFINITHVQYVCNLGIYRQNTDWCSTPTFT